MNTEIIKQNDLVTYMNGREIDDYQNNTKSMGNNGQKIKKVKI